MCGIVGFTGNNNATDFLLKGLEKLEYRGYDSAGIALADENCFDIFKTVSRVQSLRSELKGKSHRDNTGIGHTRWATHGEPSIQNAHPQLSPNGEFAVVHNGIIENYSALKAELTAEGYQFQSETDTEVVAVLLQKYYKGDFKECVARAVKRLEGSYALGIVCCDFPDTIAAVKQSSPLIIGLGESFNAIASDILALSESTKNIVYLEDSQTAFITPHSLEVYDKNGTRLRPARTVISWDTSSAEKDGYRHFMLKEIMEQPYAIENTLAGRIKNGEVVFEGLKLTAERFKSIDRIQILACGSAYHAGVVAKYVFEELLRLPTEVDLASEYRYRNPITDSRTLAIAISQSGETADTLAAIKEAKRRGAYTLAIVNVMGSSISKAVDDVIYTKAGPEIAVATTKGYSTQLCAVYLFAIYAAKQLNSNIGFLPKLISELELLPQKIAEALKTEAQIKSLIEETAPINSPFFIGRGLDYAVALEASLKLKEISYIHSEAYAAGELKHGTISLLEKGKTVIALCGCEALREKMQSNIREVAARGAEVIICSANQGIFNETEYHINVPRTLPLFLASVEIIPFQFFAYYTALKLGHDIDKPRNLAKSVTVE